MENVGPEDGVSSRRENSSQNLFSVFTADYSLTGFSAERLTYVSFCSGILVFNFDSNISLCGPLL